MREFEHIAPWKTTTKFVPDQVGQNVTIVANSGRSIIIPRSAIIAFVADHVRAEQSAKLLATSDKQILGLE